MATSGNNVYNSVTDTLGQSQRGMNNSMQYQPVDFSQQAMNQYMNPYTDQVIDNSINNLETARQKAIQQGQVSATNSGAFGGSRHGVADSLTNEAFARQVGDMSSNLNMQNYNQALNQFNTDNQVGFQNAQNQMASSQGLANLAGQGFNMANTLDDKAFQRSEQQRVLQQQIADLAKQQFGGFTGQGQQGLASLLSALGIAPNQGVQTQDRTHGLFDYLKMLSMGYMKG